MRIGVTGAAGRVGRAVVDAAAAAGHEVVAIDIVAPPDADPAVLPIDTTDYEALASAVADCDALIHLAAIAGPGLHPDHVVHDNNVVSSYHALRAAAEIGIPRVCLASSINAVGGRFSRWPRYDYFPLDERHPTYAEDPYSLSKWIGEQQADAIARRFPGVSVASLRLHGVVENRGATAEWLGLADRVVEKQLWGYTEREAAARAFLRAATAEFGGHEVFYIVAPRTMAVTPSLELAAEHYPEVPIRGDLDGDRGFFDCRKAADLLGWEHDAD